MERDIARNLVDYIHMSKKFEKELQPLYGRCDSIMERLRDAQWFLAHGTDEDKELAAQALAPQRKEADEPVITLVEDMAPSVVHEPEPLDVTESLVVETEAAEIQVAAELPKADERGVVTLQLKKGPLMFGLRVRKERWESHTSKLYLAEGWCLTA